MRQRGFAMLALLVFMTISSGVLAGLIPNMLFIANRQADRQQRPPVAENSVPARNRLRLRILRALYLRQLFSDYPSLQSDQRLSIEVAITKLVLRRRELSFVSGQAAQAAHDIVNAARERLELLLIRAGIASKAEAAERARHVLEVLGSTDGK